MEVPTAFDWLCLAELGEGQTERRKLMSNNDNRVLIRKGARPLAQNEIDEVTGAVLPSVLSVLRTNSPSGSDFTTDE
jgi:hypothetical protein